MIYFLWSCKGPSNIMGFIICFYVWHSIFLRSWCYIWRKKNNKKAVLLFYYYLPESNNSLKSSLLHFWLLSSVENRIMHKKAYTFSSSSRKKKIPAFILCLYVLYIWSTVITLLLLTPVFSFPIFIWCDYLQAENKNVLKYKEVHVFIVLRISFN